MQELEQPPQRDLLLERPLPSAPEAEQSFLGSIFLDNSLIAEAVDLVKPDDLYVPSNRYIFKAMIACFEAGEEINYATVRNELNLAGNQVDALYISNLSYGLVHVTSLKSYAKIIKGKSLLRQLVKSANRITAEALEEEDDPNVIVDHATKSILEVSSNISRKGFSRISAKLDEVVQKAEAMQGHGALVTGFPTGFQDLDELTGGFQPGDLVVIAARPSMGKTSFVLNIASNAALSTGKAVGIFSLEMSEESLVIRLLCSHAKVDQKKFRAGLLSNAELNRLNIAVLDLEDVGIYVDDTPAISSLELKSKARRLQGELELQGKELGCIVTDYLQLMSGERNKSREQEVSLLSADGKTVAKELKIPHILVSQLSRSCESRTDKRPILSDLRDSGAIEQNSDTVIFLYRDEYYNKLTEAKNIAEVIIAKQRNGPTDTKYLRWDPFITRFDSLTTEF